MNNSRDAQKREDMLLELYKFHAYIPNDAMGNPLTPFGNFCEGWQAATEQSQKEIAELEANNDKVKLALASIRDIFEYDDEMVMSGALSYPEDVAGFVKTKVATLQAREKALVEALQNLVEDISKTHGNYTYEQAWINADKALDNAMKGKV